ncbi:MAG: L-threonylcarbamoyladenylate synthase [Nitrospirota bacterium]|nr:L-threonylcarbamoyladenylate synthase [Nitrospirota bacterium]
MKLIKISETAITTARRVIEQGGIVAFPTETFYGLGVKYNDSGALKRLYEIKQRPREKAMPLIIGEIKTLVLITPSVLNTTKKLMKGFWPGPLTILFEAGKNLSEFITAGTGKAAVRIPGDSFALDLARSLEFPVTATSANISGKPPADNPDDVIGYFGDGVDLVIDGGRSTGGMASTIVDITGEGITILRPGAISSGELHRYLSGPGIT